MRHQSERVPGKNVRLFNGKPLCHYILETLAKVEQVSKIVVDTDSPTVREYCDRNFPDVAIVARAQHLQGGHVPMTDVLQHDASLFPSEWYLQTHSTNPLLSWKTIESAIERLETSLHEFDSLMSVTRLQARVFDQTGCPINHDPKILQRTQDLAPLFVENSNLYLFSGEQIAGGERFGDRPLFFEIGFPEATDIDEEEDFLLAELLHRKID